MNLFVVDLVKTLVRNKARAICLWVKPRLQNFNNTSNKCIHNSEKIFQGMFDLKFYITYDMRLSHNPGKLDVNGLLEQHLDIAFIMAVMYIARAHTNIIILEKTIA